MKFNIFLSLSFSLFITTGFTDNLKAFQKGLEEASYYQTAQGNTLRYTFFKSPTIQEKKTFCLFREEEPF